MEIILTHQKKKEKKRQSKSLPFFYFLQEKKKSDMENYFSPPGEATLSLVPPTAPSLADTTGGLDITAYPRPAVTLKAKVLYDYDAADKNELSLLADEVSVRAFTQHFRYFKGGGGGECGGYCMFAIGVEFWMGYLSCLGLLAFY